KPPSKEVLLRWQAGQLQGFEAAAMREHLAESTLSSHANLVVVPRHLAFDFLLFCQRNPRPCPLLDVTEPGSPQPRLVAPGADLRTDLPRYCVYRYGELIEEPTDLSFWWRDDLVAFLLGCSFTFESALLSAGLPLRHLEMGRNVPMYRTNIACVPAGAF